MNTDTKITIRAHFFILRLTLTGLFLCWRIIEPPTIEHWRIIALICSHIEVLALFEGVYRLSQKQWVLRLDKPQYKIYQILVLWWAGLFWGLLGSIAAIVININTPLSFTLTLIGTISTLYFIHKQAPISRNMTFPLITTAVVSMATTVGLFYLN